MDVEELHAELVPIDHATLFRTDDPVQVLVEARRVAEHLKSTLIAGGMIQKIRQSEHVKLEGWQTVGAMLGVTPHIAWSRRIDLAETSSGWEARAEARTIDGRVIGAAEAMCSRDETSWSQRPDYQLRSMAQTRAMSKAMSGPLRFIVTLAGLSGTPAEELDDPHAYGPPAKKAHQNDAVRAVTLLYGGDLEAAGTALLRIEEDAGDYLPRIVARALMLTAAHRPDNAEPAAGSTPENTDGS